MNEKKEIRRRDATGHLDPEYQRKLLESSRENQVEDDDKAFLRRPRTGEDIAEELGEAYVQSATSAQEAEEERRDQVNPEESGGPFVTTAAEEEFAEGTDASNIPEATREPLPRTSRQEP